MTTRPPVKDWAIDWDATRRRSSSSKARAIRNELIDRFIGGRKVDAAQA